MLARKGGFAGQVRRQIRP